MAIRVSRKLRVAVGVGVVGLTSLVVAADAAAVADFVTPRKAAYCGVSEGEPPFHLICWRPRDGLTLVVRRLGRATKEIHPPNRGYYDPAPGRLLRFGQSWKVGAYWRCVSRSTGLTCRNRAGHGWWVGRSRGSRLF
jgi:Family of unknown function (DUF6636)